MKRQRRDRVKLRGVGYSDRELAAQALDFCIIEGCPERCEGDELPVGWALFSIMRRRPHPHNPMQLGAALCPLHTDMLLQQLKEIRSTGAAVYEVDRGEPPRGAAISTGARENPQRATRIF
jgi:hypothetical protein